MELDVIIHTQVYNGEKTLPRTIESVLAQTYSDFIYIISDNASTDKTRDIIREYAKKDSRIITKFNKTNYFHEYHNVVFECCRKYPNGYWAMLDADDEYKPEFIENMLAFIDEAELDIAVCGSDFIDENSGQLLGRRQLQEDLIINGVGFSDYFTQYHELMQPIWGKLYPIKLLRKCKFELVEKRAAFGGDKVFVTEAYGKAIRFGIKKGTLHRYYFSPTSISSKYEPYRLNSDIINDEHCRSTLIEKYGKVSDKNDLFLQNIFIVTICATLKTLLSAKMTFSERVSYLLDFISNERIKTLYHTYPQDSNLGITLRYPVFNWLVKQNESRKPNGANQAAEILGFMLPELPQPHMISTLAYIYMTKPYEILALLKGEIQLQEVFFDVKQVIEEVLENENPQSVLEISGYNDCLAGLISDCSRYKTSSPAEIINSVKVDRIDLLDYGYTYNNQTYANVFGSDRLSTIGELDKYDVIILFHLLENMHADDGKAIIMDLLARTEKCILVVTPMYPYDLESESEKSTTRAYHPIFFAGLDFSYIALGDKQVYTFFPKKDYMPLQCDLLPEPENIPGKMKIAYIFPHKGLSGEVKALLQQIKELSARGHTVNLYYRSDLSKRVIPSWSHHIEKDFSAQKIIPGNEKYIDHLDNEDIIVIGFTTNIDEFRDSKIPVVYWEQGYPAIYGDFGKVLYSNSEERAFLHKVYRTPICLLAVSQILCKIFREVYNRDSLYYPNGIDTDFYYPLEQKKNETPVVLIVGNPTQQINGFAFAMTVLGEVAKSGIHFKTWWVSQEECSLKSVSFEIEQYVRPSQEKLAELYRNADVFLSTSLYESFPLPPMEAMASGTAVISTDNGGIMNYAEPGHNCILCDQGDSSSMMYALCSLLESPQARESLAAAGCKTAKKYSFKNTAPQLERCLYKIIAGNG